MGGWLNVDAGICLNVYCIKLSTVERPSNAHLTAVVVILVTHQFLLLLLLLVLRNGTTKYLLCSNELIYRS